MKPHFLLSLFVVSGAAGCTSNRLAERSFRFEYHATVSGFPAGAEKARVWLPLPADDEAQTVTDVKIEAPVAHKVQTEQGYGNRIVYVEVTAPFPEELPVTVSMNVHRKEVHSVAKLGGSVKRDRLLAGDRLAPISDEAKERAAIATKGQSGAQASARGIYDKVLADVTYDKSGQGWGEGNLAYVCEAGKGNCSDFHTLFIAMARSKEIPAVFEIGFPLPKDKAGGAISGYHCWAWYAGEDGRWRPVDASEADKDPTRKEYYFGTICENRVAFSRGRDLMLNPPQAGEPLNFFIYPYVEVDGKPGAVKVEKEFRFRNL